MSIKHAVRYVVSIATASFISSTMIEGCVVDFSPFGCLIGAAVEGGVPTRIQSGYAYGCVVLVRDDGHFIFREAISYEEGQYSCNVSRISDGYVYTLSKEGCVCDPVLHTCDGAPEAKQTCAFGTGERWKAEDDEVVIRKHSENDGCVIKRTQDQSFLFIHSGRNKFFDCGEICLSGECDMYVRDGDCNCRCPDDEKCMCELGYR